MTPTAIEANHLSKRFGTAMAVTDLNLSVPTGTVLGLLGPNGSGKTTTVRMLATLAKPTSGTARILGLDVAAHADRVRRHIGLTGQFTAVDPNLTGRENLLFVARLLGLGRRAARRAALDMLDRFSLGDVSGDPARTSSGGMRRRLDLAASLLAEPSVLFLDEPTTGLDPVVREQLWEIIRTLVGRGCTVLLTTQYLEEADRLADAIVILDHGRKAAEGTPAQLKRLIGNPTLTLRARDPADGPRLREVAGTPASLDQDGRTVRAPLPAEQVTAVIRAVDDAAIPLDSISLREPDLDDVFRRITTKETTR